jgi:dimethylaniline monooxygenase (N-oxide forming)
MPSVAIIGAGASGLAAAHAAIKEGLEPSIFEASTRIGGVWSPDNARDRGPAWPGMQTNISRHTGTFINFAWPDDAPDYPTTQQVYDYLYRFAEHFNLLAHIRFRTRLESVIVTENNWSLRLKDDKEIFHAAFDFLIIATGRCNEPYIPEFEGHEKIFARATHCATVQPSREYAAKKILVVGGSYSGTAIAEALGVDSQVTHLFRNPRTLVKRYRTQNPDLEKPLLPRDLIKTTAELLQPVTPADKQQWLLKLCQEQNKIPAWNIENFPMAGVAIADNYLAHVRAGRINPQQGEISFFEADQAVLSDGRRLEFDNIIFCTGYQASYPFLQDYLGELPLHENIFPVFQPGIAFIGFWEGSRGAVFPLVQLQAEWACGVFSGRLSLPAEKDMRAATLHTPAAQEGGIYTKKIAEIIGTQPLPEEFPQQVQDLLLNTPPVPARFLLCGPYQDFQQGVAMLESVHQYRQKLLQNSSPSQLLSGSIFKPFSNADEKTDVKTNSQGCADAKRPGSKSLF